MFFGLAGGVTVPTFGHNKRPSPLDTNTTVTSPATITTTTTTAAQVPIKKARPDFSNFRLPSGKFYCATCRASLPDEAHMSSHMDSKKHRSASAALRTREDASRCVPGDRSGTPTENVHVSKVLFRIETAADSV